MIATKQIENILKDLGFNSLEEAAIQQAVLILLSKVTKFEAEDNNFRKKYNDDFKSFSEKIKNQKEKENFKIEEDLLDWQFAVEALTKYKHQYSQLH